MNLLAQIFRLDDCDTKYIAYMATSMASICASDLASIVTLSNVPDTDTVTT